MSQVESPPLKPSSEVEQPPVDIRGILLRLGPGLIIAGSIVGSGELIATTKTGAEAGFWLLWLIVIGCVIKVFVQVELGRDAIVRGKTTMDALSEVPGPRLAGRGNWVIWYYFLMFAASIGQLGGIVGGVGQAMAISMPLTPAGRSYNAHVELETQLAVAEAELAIAMRQGADGERVGRTARSVAALEEQLQAAGQRPAHAPDDRIWAAIIAVVTSGLLLIGRYGLIQNFSTAMVAAFTFVTLGNLLALQFTESWGITWDNLVQGLSFRLPPESEGQEGKALSTALKTFGIIGVGATELVAYPYWCLEKGYARFTGPRDGSSAWAERARGWMHILRWDAWCSMVIYTIATVAFYLLGAAILGRSGLNPGGNELIRTLAVMYEPVFGALAPVLFLVGAFAVLYSTFFVANAGHARVVSDALRVIGLGVATEEANRARIRMLSGVLPLVCLTVYLVLPTTPDQLVLLSGMMQALMLPMLSGAALYFRYRKCDPRIAPGKLWDAFLWLSSLGMLVAGGWLAYSELARAWGNWALRMARFVTHLEGSIDGQQLPADQLQTLHQDRPILVRYDLDAVGRALARNTLRSRPETLWRYRELLPYFDDADIVSLGERMTPLLACRRLGARLGLRNLWVKDESQLPTGSFKSRGMALAITMARRLGVRRVALPTAGNAGGAAAAYAARAGLECFVFMPDDTPVVNQYECRLAGARTFLVNGLINDCGRIVREGVEQLGWFDLSTLKEPYRLEGKKTMGLELAEQCEWTLPDVIVYPTGGGTGLVGMWKAFEELRQLGWLEGERLPRMVSVQSTGCAPIVRAFEAGARFANPFQNAKTSASGLRVPSAVGDFLILDAIRASSGTAIAVEEERLGEWQQLGASLEGIAFCPETAACIGAVEQLATQGWIEPSERVVVFNTGAAQKYVEAIRSELPRIDLARPIDWPALTSA